VKAQRTATRMLVVNSSGCDYVCAGVAFSVAAVPGRPKAVCLSDSVGFKCHSQQSLGSPRDYSKLQATKGEKMSLVFLENNCSLCCDKGGGQKTRAFSSQLKNSSISVSLCVKVLKDFKKKGLVRSKCFLESF